MQWKIFFSLVLFFVHVAKYANAESPDIKYNSSMIGIFYSPLFVKGTNSNGSSINMKTDPGTEIGIQYTSDIANAFQFVAGLRYDVIRYHLKQIQDDTYNAVGVTGYSTKQDYYFKGFGPFIGFQIGYTKDLRMISAGINLGVTTWKGCLKSEYNNLINSEKIEYDAGRKMFLDTKFHAGYGRVFNSVVVGAELFYRYSHANYEEVTPHVDAGFKWNIYGVLLKLNYRIK